MKDMLKEYKKILILFAVLLILLIMLIVFVTKDMDLGFIKSVAIFNISNSKKELEELVVKEANMKDTHHSTLVKLETAKNSYAKEKATFDKIEKSTVDMIQEATKDEKYFIEYLWITLGSYAIDNQVTIDILTPGSTASSAGETLGAGVQDPSAGGLGNALSGALGNTTAPTSGIKIVIKGRYANIADFIYDVENDKELKFRLDNIKMSYASKNQIETTFSVLNLQIQK